MNNAELRVVAIADADSFVKWSASLLSGIAGIRRHMLLVRTPLTVSAAQERTALTGTSFTDADITRLGFDEVHGWLTGHMPDVVVLSGRGPFVRLMARQIDRLTQRPVVVSGLPGMSIPAQRGALEYRRESDLLVVHSHREERAFAELGRRIGIQVPTALAVLPFARMAPDAVTAMPARVSERELVGAVAGGASRSARPAPAPRTRVGGTDLVFAAQALVPAARHEREQIVEMLRLAAVADPTKRVVVKLRSRPGEAEAHLERDAYADLLADRPRNLVISHAPMSTALARAEGLVTVSSTAAIEALAQKVPVIALDTFGVHKTLLNTVFTGSGLLGGAEEVVGRRFRHPLAGWQRDNYFQPESDTNWWRCVEELVALRREGRLRAKVVPTGRGGALHAAWHRKSVLAGEDRSVLGSVALGVGAPLVNGILSMRRARGKAGEDTWSDPTTDYTLEPTPHHDPIRR
ncbi:DUF6716 putative glycosyltransferase [Microbacterium murale]|uniref:Uncharacterized protein n=1 Tax=Microbacterium murale TaxID=1081040 RepID=A0ABU0P839_9MICO|nr:DUF6716 putative glycosyltransferase [Microbacterium murale]MDQ0643495.1 hypothetical protein [Microbacterium murale]